MQEQFPNQATRLRIESPSIAPLGDAAVRIECGAADDPETAQIVMQLAAALTGDRCPGVTDIVSAYATVVVHYDPVTVFGTGASSAYQTIATWIERRLRNIENAPVAESREIVVPVAYGGEFGPDLASVAEQHGMSVEDIVRRHAQVGYTVRAIGFSPGFPYLDGLPEDLHTPRRATPRTSVPAGSVGIGGAQTGIYPLASPGGWNLIGRTPLRLFRPNASPAALLRTGDQFRFERINAAEFDAIAQTLERDAPHTANQPSHDTVLEVLQPGLQTTIQDLGRPGHQAEGVTPGGAMDLLAARVANLIVGNNENAAFLEAVLMGPRLQVIQDAVVAITGGTVSGAPGWRPFHVSKGQDLDCTQIENGARIYIAVAGGLDAQRVLDGCGTDLRAGFGGCHGRALAAGDRLALAQTEKRGRTLFFGEKSPDPFLSARWFISPLSLAPRDPEGGIRVLRGPQAEWLSDQAWTRLLSESYIVSPQSNRMGIRLSGLSLNRRKPREMASEPVVHGAIQVPPSGQPIVLTADRQTIGGYPTIACVVSADRSALVQLRPGDRVHFAEVNLAQAEALLAECEQNIAIITQAIKQHV